MIKFHIGEIDEIGVPSGYLNSKGDTIIPTEKYYYCYTDTIKNFGMVLEKGTGKIIGINQNGIELFEIAKIDNGPDYIKNGLFRIIKNNMYGYANKKGEIIIEPKFKCAHPFFMGKAQVSDSCIVKTSSRQQMFLSNNWYYINSKGNKIEK
ncbi:conserved protein of unknown function [Tenacibaculum sp. 190130A14a]|uniref:WG repeat-containing protein n=1 Tax=Tenacibaculum polynesiense TaxID=3137857 RepID=A0ABP1F4F2_9FLAO